MEKQLNDANFGLTAESFTEMVNLLRGGDEALFEHIFRRHFQSCRSYLIYEKGVPADDAYDATLDTLLYFRTQLIAGKIQFGNLRFLFTRIAFLTHCKSKGKQIPTTEMEDLPFDPADDAPLLDFEADDLDILEESWKKLDEKCQINLRMRIYEKLQAQQVAELQGRKPDAVAQETKRCIAALKTWFFKLAAI
jgi:DNA-directed RNA polymerase specialized sigma24 family protein